MSHETSPGAPAWQAPLVQVLTGPQATRHSPQLAGSVLVSVQPPLHAVSPVGQVSQLPARHA